MKIYQAHFIRFLGNSMENYCSHEECAEFAMKDIDVCELHANLKLNDVDFDTSIAAWSANKRKKGACYVYICGALKKNNLYCKKKIYQNSGRCKGHLLFLK